MHTQFPALLLSAALLLTPALAAEESAPEVPEPAQETLESAAPVVYDPNTAYVSTQTVDLDGRKVEFQMYALMDENGNPTNYIKLRDLAVRLAGTRVEFAVEWDGLVTIRPGQTYIPNGTELSASPFTGDQSYQWGAATYVGSTQMSLSSFVLTDAQGGGHTYYKLRDLGQALGFNVGWSAQRGVYIETNKPYQF